MSAIRYDDAQNILEEYLEYVDRITTSLAHLLEVQQEMAEMENNSTDAEEKRLLHILTEELDLSLRNVKTHAHNTSIQATYARMKHMIEVNEPF